MNSAWAIRMARGDASALGTLRLSPGVEVAEDGAVLWIRGQRCDGTLYASILSLPAHDRFVWLEDNRLCRVGERIPSHKLPDFPWRPLDQWIRVSLPPAGFATTLALTVPLKLLRGGAEQAPGLLLTTLRIWANYVIQAPEIRLSSLRFAVDGRERVLIRGRPLPPIEGHQWVETDGIAIRAGFCWVPAVSVEMVRRRFEVAPDTLILWHEDGSLERLHAEQFIPATRGNVRSTRAAENLSA